MTGFVPGGETGSEVQPKEKARRSRPEIRLKNAISRLSRVAPRAKPKVTSNRGRRDSNKGNNIRKGNSIHTDSNIGMDMSDNTPDAAGTGY